MTIQKEPRENFKTLIKSAALGEVKETYDIIS